MCFDTLQSRWIGFANRFAASTTMFALMLTAMAILPSNLAAQTYTAYLSGGSEVPSVPSTGSGLVIAVVDGDSLIVEGEFSGLISDFNENAAGGSHIHIGWAGRNGPISIPLNPTLTPDDRGGVFDPLMNRFELDAMQKAALAERRFYVNVHSDDFAGGELRGQLLPQADATFEVTLSGAACVPDATTTAYGAIVGELHGDILRLSGSFSDLAGVAQAGAPNGAIHIHGAYAGGVGDMVFRMNPILEPDFSGGTLPASGNVFRLTPGQMDVLSGRGFYVDVHTNMYPTGELRGQVLPTSDLYFEGHFSGLNEVPPHSAGGTGGVAVELKDDQLVVTGTFAQMVSPFNPAIAGGAHLHAAGPNENGSIAIPLNAQLDEVGGTGHFFAAPGNTFTVSEEQIDQLLAGGMYANVHTVASPGGELRAQVLRSPNNAPPAPGILQPAPGRMTTGGPGNAPFGVDWTVVDDPNGDDVVFIWQFSHDEEFSRGNRLADVKVAAAELNLTQADVDSYLEKANLPVGLSRPFYHRVIASDGSAHSVGPAHMLRITRGELTAPGSTGDEPGSGSWSATSIVQESPMEFSLKGAYPNPFNPTTNIVFDLDRDADVSVDVFDVAGRPVLTLEPRAVSPGQSRAIRIDAGDLPAGVYFYRVQAVIAGTETTSATGRMVLLK